MLIRFITAWGQRGREDHRSCTVLSVMSELRALSSSVITRTSQPSFCQVIRSWDRPREGRWEAWRGFSAFNARRAQGEGSLPCLLCRLCVGGCRVARLVDAVASKCESMSRVRGCLDCLRAGWEFELEGDVPAFFSLCVLEFSLW